MPSETKIPILITGDIDPTPEMCLDEKHRAMEVTDSLFDEFGIKSTIFCVGNVASEYRGILNKWVEKGHQIGCHGLDHSESEEYSRLDEHTIRKNLTEATLLIEAETGQPSTVFRGPRVKTSHRTQKVLLEKGYRADLSVCSQRLDFVSSNLINFNWLAAPRLPYHPSENSAFRRGKRPITVIPNSALIVPFISSAMYVLGVKWMKRLFDLLYKEARRRNKPIVYLFHPQEFGSFCRTIEYRTSLQSILARGFYIRRKLKLSTAPDKRVSMHRSLFKHIAGFPDAEFMTVDTYLRHSIEK